MYMYIHTFFLFSSDSTPRSWPLCAAELKSHMISSVDTTTCLRRNSFTNPFSPTNFCDRMGDRNVFHMIHQENVTDLDRYPDQSVLMVSARLDGVNIFDKMEVGYGSPTSSIVTLLATAELLNRYIFKLLIYIFEIKLELISFCNTYVFEISILGMK